MRSPEDWEVLLREAPDDLLAKEHARRFGGGRPTVMKPCEHCGQEFSARGMREHLPRCATRFKKKLAEVRAKARASKRPRSARKEKVGE